MGFPYLAVGFSEMGLGLILPTEGLLRELLYY